MRLSSARPNRARSKSLRRSTNEREASTLASLGTLALSLLELLNFYGRYSAAFLVCLRSLLLFTLLRVYPASFIASICLLINHPLQQRAVALCYSRILSSVASARFLRNTYIRRPSWSRAQFHPLHYHLIMSSSDDDMPLAKGPQVNGIMNGTFFQCPWS